MNRIGQRGFTMVELMAAATVLAIGLLGLLSVLVSGTNQTQETIDEQIATRALHARIEEVLSYSKWSFTDDSGRTYLSSVDSMIARIEDESERLYGTDGIVHQAVAGVALEEEDQELLDKYAPANVNLPLTEVGDIQTPVQVTVYLLESKVPLEMGGMNEESLGNASNEQVFYGTKEAFSRNLGPMDLDGGGAESVESMSTWFVPTKKEDGYYTYKLKLVPIEFSITWLKPGSMEPRTIRRFITVARTEQ